MLTLEDLGVLREVERGRRARVVVAITPTYSGCPAMADDARRPGAPRSPTPASPTSGSRSSCRRPGPATGSPSAAGRRWPSHGLSAARPGPAPGRPDPARPCSPPRRTRPLPAVRLGRGRADLGVRRDRLQGALPLHRLPRALRAREGDLMAPPSPQASQPRAFHTLTVAASSGSPTTPSRSPSRCPTELADDFAFAAGQSLTLRRIVDGSRSTGGRTPSARRPGRRPRVGVREIPDGLFSRWLVHEVAPGDRDRGADPDRPASAPTRPPGGRHLCIAAGSGITPMLSIARTVLANPDGDVTLLYGNRTTRLGDVRRGARRPEEPLRPAVRSSCTCSPASPATSSCSPAGWTPTGCAACSTRWCRSARSTTSGCAARTPMIDDARRAVLAELGVPGRAGALRAVLRRRAAAASCTAPRPRSTGETSEVTVVPRRPSAAPPRCRATRPILDGAQAVRVRPAVRLQGRRLRHLPGAGHARARSTCAATTRWSRPRSTAGFVLTCQSLPGQRPRSPSTTTPEC